MLSDYCKKNADNYGIKVGDVKKKSLISVTKLIMCFITKIFSCMSLRMKLAKIDRVIKFKQSDLVKKYIDFNTEKNKKMLLIILKKIFLKLIINSVNGKTVENLRKRIIVRLVTNEKDFLKYTSRPTHIIHKIFVKNFAAIHEIKPVLILKKPIYVEFTGLELSKFLMYDFHYNFIKKKLMLNCYLLTQTVLLMK